tara:strand:+ start:7016 stop:7933 length:918 start_codon:yes stop_codon:yes gene_type:complete
MKNIKILTFILAIFMLNTSCDNDGGTSFIPLETGAMSNFTLGESSPAFIDLATFNSLSLQFNVNAAYGTPTSTDLKAFWTTVDGNLYGPITIDTDITDLPKDFTVTGADLLSSFTELSSTADINVGDKLTLFTSFTFADGRTLDLLNEEAKPNYYAPDFDSFPDLKVLLSFTVSCNSDLGGTHSYVSSNLQAGYGYGCPTGEVTGTVTFEDQGGGAYLISDLGFGQYPSSCWGDGPATSGGAIVTEVCGKLITGGKDQYGLTYDWVITGISGSELFISWTNDYADSGDVIITREGGADWPPLFTE